MYGAKCDTIEFIAMALPGCSQTREIIGMCTNSILLPTTMSYYHFGAKCELYCHEVGENVLLAK